jgi:hypothetical protein
MDIWSGLARRLDGPWPWSPASNIVFIFQQEECRRQPTGGIFNFFLGFLEIQVR